MIDPLFAATRRLIEMLPQGAPAEITLDEPRGPSLVEISSRPVTYAMRPPTSLGGPRPRPADLYIHAPSNGAVRDAVVTTRKP